MRPQTLVPIPVDEKIGCSRSTMLNLRFYVKDKLTGALSDIMEATKFLEQALDVCSVRNLVDQST